MSLLYGKMILFLEFSINRPIIHTLHLDCSVVNFVYDTHTASLIDIIVFWQIV